MAFVLNMFPVNIMFWTEFYALQWIMSFMLLHHPQIFPILLCLNRTWFSDQKDWQSAVDVLKPRLQQYPKALKWNETHWVTSDSVIDGIQRSNQCAERAIQIMEEMFPRCKSAEKLNKRFILSNNQFP
jgi:hypothetical protein